MSVEAISWALNLAPVPADRGGQPSSACKFVLVGLANHAGPDGTGAFPSVATLVRYTGLSERTVRTCLDRLEAEGIIRPCDPDIVAARIKRADRRPQGWDLNLSLIRADLTDAEVAVLEHQFPGLGARAAAAACPDTGEARTGCNHRTPQALWITRLTGCSRCTPHPGRGATSARTRCNQCSHGVQQLHPNRPRNHPWNRPPPPRVRARHRLPVARRGGGPAGEFFAALGGGWRLTAAQRARLVPAVTAALKRAGRRERWRRSPERTPAACETPTQSWPPGSRPPNCHRRGATGAAALVWRVRPDHPDARLRQRRAPPVPTLQTGMHTAGQARPQTAPTASIALTRAGQHRYPRGRGSRIPARAPGKRPGATAGQTPVPSPAVTITGGERIPRQRGTSLLQNAD